ncbi:MAG: hypothetical protein ACM3SS_05770 [Rhodospirillaceae bacterium]
MTSKFRIKLKLQGLELEVEGAREDIPLITRNVGQQLAGMLQPAGAIVEGKAVMSSPVPQGEVISGTATRASKKRVRGGRSDSGSANGADTIDWRHDPQLYGNPKQKWTTADKCIWLMYVAAEAAGVSEMPAGVIGYTFNKHFKQAGTVHIPNVHRDLGNLKAKRTPALVGEDTTKSPSCWFLTQEGRAYAQTLVAQALAVGEGGANR